MRRTVELGEHSVELNSSAGWLYIYRNNFGRDILPDIMPMLQGLLTIVVEFLKESEDGVITIDNLVNFADEETIDNLAATLSGLETITVLNIFWSMAKNADKTIPNPEEFFGEFDCLALDVMIPEMLELVVQSSVSSKNATSLLTQLKGATSKVSQSH